VLRAWQQRFPTRQTMARTNDYGPNYYQRGSIPVWEFIRDQGLNFHLGNAIKYICRAGYKGIDGRSLQDAYIKDLTKAIHYLQNELENQIIDEPSKGVSPWLSSDERYWASFTGDAEAFDR
jgi:hypothetical protein